MTVPATAVTERPVATTSVPRLELDPWRSMGFRAGITSRAPEFDMGLFADGRAGSVMENWLLFSTFFRGDFPAIVVSRQVHGSRIQVHTGLGAGWHVLDGIDGHLTSAPGLLLTITIADCIPIYLAHPESSTICLLHAGWRGVAANILEQGIDAVAERANCDSGDIVMHCGVGICGECYEVGPEVVTAVTGRLATGNERLDLRGALAERGARHGLREITVSSWCSSHDMDQFFSHRRSRGSDGRMVAYLGVPRGL